MSLVKIAWRSLQQRSLSSLLTGLSMALGVALVVAVLVIYGVAEGHFRRGAQGYDLIVGAKGGKLQLVMNTVYHLSQPIENIPYSYYKEFLNGKYAGYTKLAIPLCMGDSWIPEGGSQTFRVVGTTPDLFEKIQYGQTRAGKPLHYAFQSGGRNFKHENFFEAVVGSVVASVGGLEVGSTFQPSHGIVEAGVEAHEHEPFTVVGVLEPTGTPNDRAIFINMEGFYLLEDHAKAKPTEEKAEPAATHDHAEDHAHADEAAPAKQPAAAPAEKHEHAAENAHDEKQEHAHADEHTHAGEHAHDDHDHGHDHAHGHHHHHEPLPENQREVTAILVLATSGLFAQPLFTAVNEGNVAQAVFPTQEIVALFDGILGPLEYILLLFAGMIVIVAGIGVMVSIYNSIAERRHEIAIMRALGASQGSVLSIILLECMLLSALGGVAGIVLGHSVLALFSPYVVQKTGVIVNPLQFAWGEWVLIPAVVLLAALVGLVPARAAYRTDVAKSLGST